MNVNQKVAACVSRNVCFAVLQSASLQLSDDPFEVKLRDIYEVGSLFMPVFCFCLRQRMLVY